METTHKIEPNNGCEICQLWLNEHGNWNPETKEKPKLNAEFHATRSKSELTKEATKEEIFASNIQEAQLREVIPQYEWNEKRLQEERDYFLWWLTKSKNEDKLDFSDQLSAWEEYKRQNEFIEIDEEDEEYGMSWDDELWKTFTDKVFFNQRNYSDYAGQQ